MKIDEACINHNVIRFISDLVASRYEFLSSENERQDQTNRDYMIMTLGEIGGVIELAVELKKVLKA